MVSAVESDGGDCDVDDARLDTDDADDVDLETDDDGDCDLDDR